MAKDAKRGHVFLHPHESSENDEDDDDVELIEEIELEPPQLSPHYPYSRSDDDEEEVISVNSSEEDEPTDCEGEDEEVVDEEEFYTPESGDAPLSPNLPHLTKGGRSSDYSSKSPESFDENSNSEDSRSKDEDDVPDRGHRGVEAVLASTSGKVRSSTLSSRKFSFDDDDVVEVENDDDHSSTRESRFLESSGYSCDDNNADDDGDFLRNSSMIPPNLTSIESHFNSEADLTLNSNSDIKDDLEDSNHEYSDSMVAVNPEEVAQKSSPSLAELSVGIESQESTIIPKSDQMLIQGSNSQDEYDTDFTPNSSTIVSPSASDHKDSNMHDDEGEDRESTISTTDSSSVLPDTSNVSSPKSAVAGPSSRHKKVMKTAAGSDDEDDDDEDEDPDFDPTASINTPQENLSEEESDGEVEDKLVGSRIPSRKRLATTSVLELSSTSRRRKEPKFLSASSIQNVHLPPGIPRTRITFLSGKASDIGIAGLQKGSGLNSVMAALQSQKQTKLTTLEKSRLDWQMYKKAEGIDDELRSQLKGRNGFLEKRDFLERSDHRQFEIEKNMRAKQRRNPLGT